MKGSNEMETIRDYFLTEWERHINYEFKRYRIERRKILIDYGLDIVEYLDFMERIENRTIRENELSFIIMDIMSFFKWRLKNATKEKSNFQKEIIEDLKIIDDFIELIKNKTLPGTKYKEYTSISNKGEMVGITKEKDLFDKTITYAEILRYLISLRAGSIDKETEKKCTIGSQYDIMLYRDYKVFARLNPTAYTSTNKTSKSDIQRHLTILNKKYNLKADTDIKNFINILNLPTF